MTDAAANPYSQQNYKDTRTSLPPAPRVLQSPTSRSYSHTKAAERRQLHGRVVRELAANGAAPRLLLHRIRKLRCRRRAQVERIARRLVARQGDVSA